MTPVRKAASLTGVERRAVELDTIASVLPIERRDELAELGSFAARGEILP